MIRGFLVNKFRGDPALFEDGMRVIAELTSWPALGLVPFCVAATRLPAEDSMALSGRAVSGAGPVTIAVPVLPGIANFDDLDPLTLEKDVRLLMVRPGQTIPVEAALVILPGSKTTLRDLAALRSEGWDIDVFAHARRGGHVLGLCGGYQMLGAAIRDPQGFEGPPGEAQGLGLLDIETEFSGAKILRPLRGASAGGGATFSGYEMHLGRTIGPDCSRPMLRFDDGRTDGAVSANGKIMGCYVHGLFADPAQRGELLARLGAEGSGLSYDDMVEDALEAIAAHLEAHLDLDFLLTLAGG
jgi:adenosylcobyric acid synthase